MTREELKDLIKNKIKLNTPIKEYNSIFDVPYIIDFYIRLTFEQLHDPFFVFEDFIIDDLINLLSKHNVSDFNIRHIIDEKTFRPSIKIELILEK